MSIIEINGVDYYYEKQGTGSETIMFSHGLLWSGRMFERQIEELVKEFTVVTYDHRGQGRTSVSINGYDMDTLTLDALALIDKLELGSVHFVGLSMGGFVGMRLAARYPEKVKSLTLIETSAEEEPSENLFKYKMLGLVARWLSMSLVAGRVMKIMFGETFMHDPYREEEKKHWREELLKNDKVGIYRALKGAISRKNVVGELSNISCPTLILVGDEDIATTPEKAETMHKHIKNSKLEIIPNAGHTSTVEAPNVVTKHIWDFITSLPEKKITS